MKVSKEAIDMWFYNADHSDEARKAFEHWLQSAIDEAYQKGRDDANLYNAEEREWSER